jgi:hypothetical protein
MSILSKDKIIVPPRHDDGAAAEDGGVQVRACESIEYPQIGNKRGETLVNPPDGDQPFIVY